MAHKFKDSKTDCVSLDLFVGDEDDELNMTQQNVVESLCLRILSKNNIKYRFGGLQIHVKSPDFHIGKSFHVNLDDNNHIDSIESYREPEESYIFGRRRVSLLGSNNLGTLPARILITPKKPTESDSNSNFDANASTSNNITAVNNLLSNIPPNTLAKIINSVNQTNNKNQMPILTADVVVEEIIEKPTESKDSQNSSTSAQSLGTTLMNTILNKKTNNSNASSINDSPSQSIHSINSLSNSMLELRSTSPSPTNLLSSPEKLISKLTLQPFNGHLDNKYIKHKNKKKPIQNDFKKRSKEKLSKNGTSDSRTKVNKKVNQLDKKVASDNNLNKITELAKDKQADKVETKSIGVCTNLDEANLSLNIPHGFFYNLRRTRSWKK